MRIRNALCGLLWTGLIGQGIAQGPAPSKLDTAASTEMVVKIMKAAHDHAMAHGGKYPPAISPSEQLLLGDSPAIDIAAFRSGTEAPVIVWTVNDVAHMHWLIQHRVEGIIADRPDVLHQVLREEAVSTGSSRPEDKKYFENFDIEAHAGGKGLRPENTLPAYEGALDAGATTIESDTGLTLDGVSLMSHDASLSPEYCRRNDGTPYTESDRVLIKDMTMAEAQKAFTCDKITPGSTQKNDLELSPVAVAFAKKIGLSGPYTPVSVAELYDFVSFYRDYYQSGSGKNQPEAQQRIQTAEKVRFNLEIKIDLRPANQKDAFPPEKFASALGGAIMKAHMEARTDIESFNFQSLLLVQEQFPAIRTVYLFGIVDPRLLYLLPTSLQKAAMAQ